jgi:hypothetical protein
MPKASARAAVTMRSVGAWVVKRQKGSERFVMSPFPKVERLPDDPEWEEIERDGGAQQQKAAAV